MTGSYLDLSNLPDYEISNRTPLWWGQTLMCVIEGVLLLALIAIYFYLRLSVDVWPPPGTRIPGASLAAFSLIFLVLSMAGSYWADAGAKKDNARHMIAGMALNLVLAGIALVFRYQWWRGFNFTWSADVHASIVWSILFLHTFDLVADLLVTTVLFVMVALGHRGPAVRLGVHVDSVLYYFLVGIWVPLWMTVQWGPSVQFGP
jgi:cytochrome c oxidase subunit III